MKKIGLEVDFCFNEVWIQAPDKPLDSEFLEGQIQMFSQFTTQFEAAVKNMAKTVADQTTKFQNHYKRDLETIGKAFMQLGRVVLNLSNQINLFEKIW